MTHFVSVTLEYGGRGGWGSQHSAGHCDVQRQENAYFAYYSIPFRFEKEFSEILCFVDHCMEYTALVPFRKILLYGTYKKILFFLIHDLILNYRFVIFGFTIKLFILINKTRQYLNSSFTELSLQIFLFFFLLSNIIIHVNHVQEFSKVSTDVLPPFVGISMVEQASHEANTRIVFPSEFMFIRNS